MKPEHSTYKVTGISGDTTVVLKLTINFERGNFSIEQLNGKSFSLQRCKDKNRCIALSLAITEAATLADKLLNDK